MQALANKLIAQARGVEAPSDAVLTESRVTASAGRIRIGFWPLICADAPDMAMGLLTILAGQLERWPDVLVYRLVVRADDDAEETPREALSSQFSVDDWQVDLLDENVAVWGELTRSSAGWMLEVSVENDLTDGEVQTLTIQGATLDELIQRMPQLAADLAQSIGAGFPVALPPSYDGGSQVGDEATATFLVQTARWERDLFLMLWRDEDGIDWAESLTALLGSAESISPDFAGWVVAAALRRALKRTTRDAVEATLERPWDTAIEALPDAVALPIVAALDAFSRDEETRALDYLESASESWPHNDVVCLALSDGYRRASKLQALIKTLQTWLAAHEAGPELLFYYAGIVVALHRSNVALSDYVFIEESGRRLEYMLQEACAAYEQALTLAPERLDMRQAYILLLVELQDERLWAAFAALVDLDEDGHYVRVVTESFVMVEAVGPAIDILEAALEGAPNRIDLHLSLAVVLLLDEEPDEAAGHLEVGASLTDDESILADIERLFLQVDDPDFDARMGEITEIVASGRGLGARDVAFLEDVLEHAPRYSAAYLLLARGLRNQEAHAEALEVLLDGQSALPEDAEVTAELAQVLWLLEQPDLAFDYLNKGLAHHPDDVPLLALTGRYLFDEGQDEEARTFLSRAQSLDPRNRVLVEAQRYIAGQL